MSECRKIKNYTTKVPASKTASEIQEVLARHGASKVMTEYDGGGSPVGICFEISGKTFRLPVRVEAVGRLLDEQGVSSSPERAEMVAWRNVKDWIAAQIAMIEIGQVGIDEVMLPYMVDAYGHTLYESMPNLLTRPEG